MVLSSMAKEDLKSGCKQCKQLVAREGQPYGWPTKLYSVLTINAEFNGMFISSNSILVANSSIFGHRL